MRTLMAILGFGLMALTGFAGAQVILYDHEGLRGHVFSVNSPINSLADYGFNDRASSAVVERGQWEVCEHAYFSGTCVILRPGQYPSLASLGMNRKISSVRPLMPPPPPQQVYAPPPPSMPVYSYYPRHEETLYTADVVATRVVMGPPEQRCWVEQQQVVKENQANIPGAIIGGVIGGVLGHQIGSGRGNAVATGVGAVGGAAVGANVNRGSQTYTQDVQRCETVPGSAQPSYWDVTYVFRGVTHRAQLSFAPGSTITVNEKGEPRV